MLQYVHKIRSTRSAQAELQDLLQLKHQKKLVMGLHTLKGNAGTLGLYELAMEAKRAEYMFANPSEPLPTLHSLDILFVQLDRAKGLLQQAVAILNAGPDSSGPVQTIPSSTKAIEAVRTLEALLKVEDMEALTKFAQLRTALLNLPDGVFEKLEFALQDLDFLAAYDICIAARDAAEAQT